MTQRRFDAALKDTRDAVVKAKEVEELCRKYLRESVRPQKP